MATMDTVADREESSSSGTIFSLTDSFLNKWRYELIMRKEYEAKQQLYMDEYMDENKKTQAEASDEITKPQAEASDEIIMEPQAEASDEIREPQAEASETFGDTYSHQEISASHLRHGVVSIALFNEKGMVYACSGAAVRHWHGNIQDHHRIFVTSARLAHKFNDNRTRDDNLRIEVRTHDNETLHGFLGLYDENIAMVTSFNLECVYTMDTSNPVDLPRGTRNNKLFAFGCATNGTLMGAKCYHPVFKATGLVSVNCKITETGLGGPVIYFGRGGSGHIAGLITGYCKEETTFLPTKMLHEWLKRLLLITSKTSHFRGYSLPHGVKTVIPSGFVVRSKILQSLGYPLPPPLVFELNGRLVGRFEEHFGQFHYWDGYPFDFPYGYGGKNLIWEQFGKDVAEKISKSVVSIASFRGERKIRCFACTGLLIKGTKCPFILTSASLVRTGDAAGEIDENLSIEVFLPPNHSVQGILELYDQNYNIAIVRLKQALSTPISPQDIFTGRDSRNNKSVVAIGRATKGAHGLLMASMGEVKGKYIAVTKRKNKHLTGPHQGLDLDCEDLLLSTCQIKKVGIGGPLIGLDGSFIGMNFYDESGTTPFLPRTEILKVLHKGFNLLERVLASRPVNMEDTDYLISKRPKKYQKKYQITRKRKRNQWPVSEPYWCLPGQGDVLDQLRGKVLM